MRRIGERFIAAELVDKDARDRALRDLRFGTPAQQREAAITLDNYLSALEGVAVASLVDELATVPSPGRQPS